jgi:hemerythrin-like domain-containing protein
MFRRLPSVLDSMRREHRHLRSLFAALDEATDGPERVRCFALLAHELVLHRRLEDEIFYPAFRRAVEGRAEEMLFHEAMQERHIADVLLEELRASDPSTADFTAKAKVLQELVTAHLTHEERRIFPLAKREMTRPHLAAMAERLTERREEIVRGAEPSLSPDRAPSG